LYYVFFDTADTALVSGITGKYTDIVVKKLHADFKSLLQAGSDHLDADKVKEYFDKGMRKMLAFLNCSVYLGCSCPSRPDCCKAHVIILASNQLESFTVEMVKAKWDFFEQLKESDPKNEHEHERVSFQNMCQYWYNARELNVKPIYINKKYSPKSNIYFNLYTGAARGYMEQHPDAFFMYIINKNSPDSHYDKFKRKLNYPPNLLDCKELP